MTIHFSQIDEQPSGLDVRPAELDGCPIVRVIESACTDPHCRNSGLKLNEGLMLSDERCLQLQEAIGRQDEPQRRLKPAIFQTQPKTRCVL